MVLFSTLLTQLIFNATLFTPTQNVNAHDAGIYELRVESASTTRPLVATTRVTVLGKHFEKGKHYCILS